MRSAAQFAYAQARVQARYARLPSDADWQHLAGVRGLAGFLEEARAATLGEWVKPLSGLSDSHDIEAGLRALYREHVEEVAGWLPEPWAPAVWWTRWLVLIPLFERLARGERLPGWVGRDHDLHGLLDEAGELDPERLRRDGAEALLVPGGEPAFTWLKEWRRRWPPGKSAYLRNLAALETLLARHLADFRRSPPESAWASRNQLRTRLSRLFHRRLSQPAGVFIYLALVLLVLERLRAELVGRALFSAREAV
jgi:hypothetical protein